MRCLLVGLALLASVAAYEDALLGYHESVGIPNAAHIKAEEERILASQALLADPLSEGRIVGGAVSATGAHSYLGGLVINLISGSLSACGSSLLSQNRLVTAAHCWFDGTNQAWQFTVVLGTNWLFSGGTRIATSQVVMHPQWNPITLANDVAMIYLPTNVWYSATIQPIALPSTSDLWESFAGEWALAAGFGKTNDGLLQALMKVKEATTGSEKTSAEKSRQETQRAQTGVTTTSVISQVNLQVISVAQCQASFGHWALASNICTNGAGGIGICGGDSGGPLVVNRRGQNVLVGISSFVANAGCQLGHPSAFARVTSFYSFIIQHLF